MNVLIKKLHDDAIIPRKAHPTDACFDIYAYVNNYPDYLDGCVCIPPHSTRKVATGFSTAIPTGYCALVYARSGLATNSGMRPANCVGVIDADYRGEWIVALHNDSDKEQHVFLGDRIAQFMIVPVLETSLLEVDELDDTNRGQGGFGSSGK